MMNMMTRSLKLASLFVMSCFLVNTGPAVFGQAVKVELSTANGKSVLMRNGKPYKIHGAGGEGPLDMLAEVGGNSNRTWGVGTDTQKRLDEAKANGISVAFGIWLEHERHGFDYADKTAVEKQAQLVLESVKKYKDHPAILVWGVGNEMEGYDKGDNPNIWNHVEDVCKRIKAIDPNHPTMAVIAELGPDDKKIKAMHKLCPNLDIIGINSYGGAQSIPERYRKYGGTKPFILTEFGPIGTWEVGKNNIDAIEEPTGHEKAKWYAKAAKAVSDDPLCLGTYAFLWGNKQEGTATWFGMLTPEGKRLPAVEVMSEIWTGQKPKNLCPIIKSFKLEGSNSVQAEQMVRINMEVEDPEGRPLNVNWTFTREAQEYVTGGDKQASPPDYSNMIKRSGPSGVTIKMPELGGLYRAFVTVSDGTNVDTANVPLRVEGKDLENPGKPVQLPYVLFNEPADGVDFHPTGWMGDTSAMKVTSDCKDNPKVGNTCIECQYNKTVGWGGVVWQNPDNDWGDKPGGVNLKGAKQLTFWVRGQDGGEVVKFGFGLIGRNMPYFDTAKKEMEVRLEKEWKQVTIDVSNLDLRRIKSGFFFSLASSNKPIRFYLDDIRFK